MPENKKYKNIEIKEDNELIIWGIVEYVKLKKFNKNYFLVNDLKPFS